MEEYWRYRLIIKFGFQGRQEEKVGEVSIVGERNRGERGEEEWHLAFGIDFQSWVLAKEKGREIEKREEKENGVWHLGLIFRVGFLGIRFDFHDCGKNFFFFFFNNTDE